MRTKAEQIARSIDNLSKDLLSTKKHMEEHGSAISMQLIIDLYMITELRRLREDINEGLTEIFDNMDYANLKLSQLVNKGNTAGGPR